MDQLEAREFCGRWLPAWTGNRPEVLIQFYDEAAYYQDPANPDGLRGHAALLAYFGKLLAKNPGWRWDCDEVFPTPTGFTLKWRAQFPGAGTIVGLDIVEISGDRITRNEVYFDTAPLSSRRPIARP